MNIKFYRSESESNVINKTLTYIDAITCDSNLYDLDLLNPTIYLTDVDTLINNANYCIINDVFYYFIESISFSVSGLRKLVLRLDTIETYKYDILNSYAECIESETDNSYYSGASYKFDLENETRKLTFDGSGFNEEGSLMLLVVN